MSWIRTARPGAGRSILKTPDANEVRRFFCDNALMWLRDFHIDGLRIDAVHAFVDRSAIHFLEQLATEVEALEASLARRLVLIAESDLNDPRVVTPREAGGFGIDAQWSDDFHHALFTALIPPERQGYYADFGSLAQLAKALEQTFVYDGIYSRYRKRIHGKPPAGLVATSISRLHPESRSGGQSRHWRPDQPHCRPGARQDRRGAGADKPLCAHAVSGRRMGSLNSVPVFRRS